jgi:hypothetical protein
MVAIQRGNKAKRLHRMAEDFSESLVP